MVVNGGLRVVGVDLSLTATGVAVITPAYAHVTTHVIRSGALPERMDLAARDARAESIVSRLWLHLPRPVDLLVIESPAFSRTTGSQHDRSGLWWRVVHKALHDQSVRGVVEVGASARARYATGKGNAGKDAVLAATVRRYPQVDVEGNNDADALVLAAMGARALGHPIDSVPLTHLTAMQSPAWPEALTPGREVISG